MSLPPLNLHQLPTYKHMRPLDIQVSLFLRASIPNLAFSGNHCIEMVPILNSGNHLGYVLIGFGLFLSATAIVALCAKHAGFVSRKCNKTSNPKLVPKSPLASPKELLTSISNKAVPFIYKKKGGDEAEAETGACRVEEGTGEGGLWQKSILMGERCQHPEFSGVIFYDGYGNQVSEPPRTPRASPLPSFSYPMAKGAS